MSVCSQSSLSLYPASIIGILEWRKSGARQGQANEQPRICPYVEIRSCVLLHEKDHQIGVVTSNRSD